MSSSLTKNSNVRLDTVLYTATKGAVEQLGRVLAKDLGARGITVNTISPGPTATPLFLESFSQEVIARVAEGHPAKRIAQSEDIAPIVAFLARDEARWVNGQNIYVNNVRDYCVLLGAGLLTLILAGIGCVGVHRNQSVTSVSSNHGNV